MTVWRYFCGVLYSLPGIRWQGLLKSVYVGPDFLMRFNSN
jgi:hypothetical protein